MRSELSFALASSVLLTVGCADNVTPAERADYTGTGPALTCLPNLDGVITSAELGAAFGVTVSFLISPEGEERVIVPAGEVQPDGKRLYDFGEDRATDQVTTVAPVKLGQQWFADSFPGGEIVLPLDAAGRNLGIYKESESAFYLLGTASAEPNPADGRTLLVYDEPVAVFKLPLEDGKSWVSQGTFKNALLLGLPFAGRHTYEVSVDGSGELLLPQLTFSQVLRVKTRLIVEPAIGTAYSVRQIGFIFECFGEVARATSRTNEPDPDFTTATEVRRIGQNL